MAGDTSSPAQTDFKGRGNRGDHASLVARPLLDRQAAREGVGLPPLHSITSLAREQIGGT
jgi:hypothetical protein